MSKKVLLKEETVRRFMKLANMSPLNEMPAYLRDDEEEAVDAPVPGMEDEALPGEGEEEELEVPLEEPVEGGEPGGEVDVQLSPEQVDALVDLGNQLEGTSEEPELEEPELEEPELEGPELEEPELEGPPDELAEIEVLDDDRLVAEVARRVARRLSTLSKKG